MKNIINNIKVMCLALLGFSFRESRAVIDPLSGTLTCIAVGGSAAAQAMVYNYAGYWLTAIGVCTAYVVKDYITQYCSQCINTDAVL
jgi:hypothetical protein